MAIMTPAGRTVQAQDLCAHRTWSGVDGLPTANRAPIDFAAERAAFVKPPARRPSWATRAEFLDDSHAPSDWAWQYSATVEERHGVTVSIVQWDDRSGYDGAGEPPRLLVVGLDDVLDVEPGEWIDLGMVLIRAGDDLRLARAEWEAGRR